MQSFPCTQCGACCRHVDLSPLTASLDRGDGTCRHHDTAQRTCTIYEHRPDICRVDLQFVQHYHQQYTWDEFVRLNLIACQQLSEMPNRTKKQLKEKANDTTCPTYSP